MGKGRKRIAISGRSFSIDIAAKTFIYRRTSARGRTNVAPDAGRCSSPLQWKDLSADGDLHHERNAFQLLLYAVVRTAAVFEAEDRVARLLRADAVTASGQECGEHLGGLKGI